MAVCVQRFCRQMRIRVQIRLPLRCRERFHRRALCRQSPIPWTSTVGSAPGFFGTPLIELDGTSAGGSANGLTIATSNSIVRGLAINRFSGAGVLISGNNAFNNQIAGNYLGTNLAGTASAGNSGFGVWITNGANFNIVGTNGDGVDDVAERNIISGQRQQRGAS